MLGKIWNWLNGNDATPKSMQQQQSNHALATSNDDEYTKLLKKYYRKFGDLLFELDNLLSKLAREIKESTGDKKTLQKIRFDLKRISSENSELVIRNGITGVWIHNSLQIAMSYDYVADCEESDGIEIDRNNYFQTNFDNIAICGDVIYYMEYPIFYHDEYGENHLYKSFSVDVSNYTKKDIDNDYPISWVFCKCYDICDETKRTNSKNPPSLLAELYRIMRVCKRATKIN